MGRGLAEGEKERSQLPALRATFFQRKEGEIEVMHRSIYFKFESRLFLFPVYEAS